MMRAMVLVAGLGMAAVCGAQTLDPSLLEKKQSTQTGFHWDFDQDKATGKRFTIEGVFCLNGYTWSPIDYNESDAIIRQTVERTRPDFSSGELQNTLSDMEYNVMWTFRNASGGGGQQIGPRLLRVRYQPVETLPVDVSLGVGRSTALFYAKSQLQETGATTGLNQTDVMATAFTDHYFHLRAIYQGSWGSEQPRVPTSWNPMLVEIGAGFAPTHRVKFIGAVAVVPGAEQSAQDWQFDAWEQGVDQSVTEITDVKASTQFVLGAQLRIGSTMWGFEQRWFRFLGDTREYILAGASNTSTPSYFCMSIGWQF